MLKDLLVNTYGLVEGTDGSGKSTILDKITISMPDIVLTREPGGTLEAERIRHVIQEKNMNKFERTSEIFLLIENDLISNRTKELLEEAARIIEKEDINGLSEAFLYAASRSESIEKVVIPTLKEGKTIFSGRSVASSVAYQGSARGLGMKEIWELNKPIVQTCLPHFELFFDIPVDIALERLSHRTEKQDRLDGENNTFFEKVREGYLYYYKNICPYPYAIIDASKTIEEVYEQSIVSIEELRKNI